MQENINQENKIQNNIKNKKKTIPFENTYIKQRLFNSNRENIIKRKNRI